MLQIHNKIYLFIDPFHRRDSGVSTYIFIATGILNEHKIKTKVIKLIAGEKIDEFRERVSKEVNEIKDEIYCIEAPESLASTKLLCPSLPIHIRLHCSRSLGAAIQGERYNIQNIRDEQLAINNATYISSPSWAAYFTSSSLFKFKSLPLLYPNPAPKAIERNLTDKKHDILFVGRLHKLKGIDYLDKIIKKLPMKSFAIVSPIKKGWGAAKRKNVTIYDGLSMNKEDIYNLADIVIVPSLFETSSMVILESLSYGCKVVTWEHLGAVEYDQYNIINKASTCKFKNFINEILLATSKTLVSNQSTIDKINSNFINAIYNINSSEHDNKTVLNKPSHIVEKYLRNLVREEKIEMGKIKTSPLIRKTKKLIRNPIGFFQDSALFKRDKDYNNEDKNTIVNKISLISKDEVPTPYIEENTHSQVSIKNNHINYCTIPKEGRVEFRNPPEKPVGYITLFLYSQDEDEGVIDDVISGLNEFKDFSCLKKENLLVGDFDISPTEKSISLINRIDFKNKTNLSKINFIFLLNPSIELCDALRSIGTEQRVIIVQTNNGNYLSLRSVDALITTKSKENPQPITRRLVHINSHFDIPLAIRRIIQEGAHKTPDMLLELTPENEAFNRNDFIKFNYTDHDGIIKLKKPECGKFNTMLDFYSMISSDIIGIAMKESAYMRYKTLCEDVEKGVPPQHLLEMCLADGIIFDVKEI